MLPFLVPVLFIFYIQGVLKLKKNSGAKGITPDDGHRRCPKHVELRDKILDA
jgi:hypothetical protein